MRFAEALAYLDEHVNREATAGVVHGLSLDRMQGMVEVLGDPHRCAPVIHVTGTNGKGSTTRMISALLAAHGLTVGTYVSPHLESITERIQRNGEPISEDDFAEVIDEIAGLESLFPARPSYFDLLTAAAFSWFSREAVDVMVVEVGMLGRYDSTNVVEADVAVITNIGRDHTDGVGDWRRAIAEEKAGIIEERCAVIIGETDPELVDVFRAEGGAVHWIRNEHFGVKSAVIALGGRQLDAWTPGARLEEVFLPLHGMHQVENASLAIAAVEAFFGRPLARDVVAEAFRSLEVPGRFEVLSRSPLVIVDVAHNPDGTATVAETLRSEFRAGPVTLIVGLLEGRDIDATLGPLLSLEPVHVHCVRADSPRAVPAEQVAEAVTRLLGEGSSVSVETGVTIDETVRHTLDTLPDDATLLVAGSTYVTGDARRALRALGLGR